MNVILVVNIFVGLFVIGNGVGWEIYVLVVNVLVKIVIISQLLYDVEGIQNFMFMWFKYMLDFLGFDMLFQFIIDDVEFVCGGIVSGMMIGKFGVMFYFKDCQVIKLKDCGLILIGLGCQGMMIDCCQFVLNEQVLDVEQ